MCRTQLGKCTRGHSVDIQMYFDYLDWCIFVTRSGWSLTGWRTVVSPCTSTDTLKWIVVKWLAFPLIFLPLNGMILKHVCT